MTDLDLLLLAVWAGALAPGLVMQATWTYDSWRDRLEEFQRPVAVLLLVTVPAVLTDHPELWRGLVGTLEEALRALAEGTRPEGDW